MPTEPAGRHPRPADDRDGGAGRRPFTGPRRLAALLRHPAAAPLGLLAAGPVGAAYLYSRDPHRPGRLLPFCPWHRLTGLQCPGCGGTRMAYDLLHGDLAAAWHDNAALLLTLPFVAAWCAVRLRHGLAGRRRRLRMGPRAVAALLAGAALWTVGRNLL
ncbi:uncharacterized protein DUF2752 [Kitasatospora sp. SolWspMP-SS2h]|uniref:DUF2752 domain-containing protein n=1 Tax=Kitasatospora sp. SolWspMP-SS2h TaxID=1305729 RepID=UPI000DBA952A|nr:uncharacterized protein DUF2752 [Kitasatospora sp. SolWspMP-SS2h]